MSKSKQPVSKPCVKKPTDVTSETVTSSRVSESLETWSNTSTAGSYHEHSDYGPIRRQRERSVSLMAEPEVREYETDNRLMTMTPRKKRPGDELPDLGVKVNIMKDMLADHDLKNYFEICLNSMREGLRSGKYKDETSAYAAIVMEMDAQFAQDPTLAEKKRCLAAVMAFFGTKGDMPVVKDFIP